MTALPPRRALEPVDLLAQRVDGNPLLDAVWRFPAAAPTSDSERDELIARFSFGIPADEALAVIAEESPQGVVEIGTARGTGQRRPLTPNAARSRGESPKWMFKRGTGRS